MKVKGAAKRILTNAEIDIAFLSVKRKVNSFVMVKGNKSPFDRDIRYWANRKSKLYEGPLAKALVKQKNKCTHCNHPFLPDDIVELHHKNGDHGDWNSRNIVALHRECHQHQEVGSNSVRAGKRTKTKARARNSELLGSRVR